jgi:hypothetical protein
LRLKDFGGKIVNEEGRSGSDPVMILPSSNPNKILGILGIFLEIAAFALTFHAVKQSQPDNNSKVSFTPNSFSKESFTTRLIKRMTEIHLRLNLAAVILVIIGVV